MVSLVPFSFCYLVFAVSRFPVNFFSCDFVFLLFSFCCYLVFLFFVSPLKYFDSSVTMYFCYLVSSALLFCCYFVSPLFFAPITFLFCYLCRILCYLVSPIISLLMFFMFPVMLFLLVLSFSCFFYRLVEKTSGFQLNGFAKLYKNMLPCPPFSFSFALSLSVNIYFSPPSFTPNSLSR